MKFELNIIGMTCANCSGVIERVTKKIEGVCDARVDFNSGVGRFEIDNTGENPALNTDEIRQNVEKKIKKLGYEIAIDYDEMSRKKAQFLHSLKLKFAISLICAILAMVCEMWLGAKFGAEFSLKFGANFTLNLFNFFALILCAISLFFCGNIFFIHGVKSLKNRNFDMNVLVLLGAGSAYFYSFVALFIGGTDFYFSSSSMIITFILLGKILEESSKISANSYIKSLSQIVPKTALLITPENKIIEILADELKIGDEILVKQGEKIPRDGEISSGMGELDLSLLNGESLPVVKKQSDKVFAGSTLISGLLHVRITTTKHETMLSQIGALLSETSAKKVKIARIADKVAGIFVPIVIAICVATFCFWNAVASVDEAVNFAISVLIISCPCALGLAVPIAIVCAISNAARSGILIKNPEILELARTCDTVFFDKTGTLTSGQIVVVSSNLSDEILREVASAELLSSHPISKAIVNFAQNRGLEVAKFSGEFENLLGLGIRAGDLIVGNSEMLAKFGINLDENFAQNSQNLNANLMDASFKNPARKNLDSKFEQEQTAQTKIFVAKNGVFVGEINLLDELRKSAKDAIDALKNQGIKSVILSGDSEKSVETIANLLNIDEKMANLSPQDKMKIVQTSQKSIFIGDGINDAIALKAARCSVSLGSATQIAQDLGDAILTNQNLTNIAKIVRLSQISSAVIRQNLFWAFFYNIICIPLAAGAFVKFGIKINPMFAAAAMSFSSLSVVVNSIRLKMKKI